MGKKTIVRGDHLQSNHTQSCGCIKKNDYSGTYDADGLSQTPEYRTWHGMIMRCYNPKDPNYKRYGMRGIKVCQEWRNSFKAFLRDMGERPKGDYSIERLDNSLDYAINNCIWADKIQQMRNRKVFKNNKTGIPDVHFETSSNKYRVRIHANNKRIHLGRFINLEDAIEARRIGELKYWGKTKLQPKPIQQRMESHR